MAEKLTRGDFKKINLDICHYYYSFGVPGFEICLEPCAEGFDVAVYEPGLVGSKRCTKLDGYLESLETMFGERKDDAWNKALEIANKLWEKRLGTVKQ